MMWVPACLVYAAAILATLMRYLRAEANLERLLTGCLSRRRGRRGMTTELEHAVPAKAEIAKSEWNTPKPETIPRPEPTSRLQWRSGSRSSHVGAGDVAGRAGREWGSSSSLFP